MMNLKKLIKLNYQQLLFVFAAFFLMVLVSYLSVSGMLREQLFKNAEKEILKAESNIKSKIMESQVTLVNSSLTIKNIIGKGGSQKDILEFFVLLTDWLEVNKDMVSGFNGIYGYIRGEYLDGSFWEPPPGYAPTERPWYTAAIKSSGSEICFTQPYVDAQTAQVIISVSNEIFDNTGKSLGVVAIDIDITPFAAYVRELEIAEGGYGILLDRDFNILAHRNQELVGTNMHDINKVSADMAERLNAGEAISAETIKNADGVREIAFYRRLFNDIYVGIITPYNVYYRDLTATAFRLSALGLVLMIILSYFLLRLSRDKLRSEEESKSKTSFLAKMNHEIRTPMNAIVGMSELILREEISPAVYRHTMSIKQAGANLLSIINDILDFSKIESGKIEIVPVNYLFASLINDVISIIRMRLMEKPILFVSNIDCSIPNKLIGDEIRIRQILLNLLSNAAKYTEEGFISITAYGKITAEDTVLLTIEISDSGIGIKETDMNKLFEDFVQFDTAKNKGIEGTGLGLAIAKNLCRAMGGDISVSSSYGKGSTFTAIIQQKFAEYEKCASVKNPEEKSVLICENRSIYAKSLASSLNNLGVVCAVVADKHDFSLEVAKYTYPFIFASPFFYESAKTAIEELGLNAKLVLLAEFGETMAAQNASSLTMPIHSIAIANILNGVSDDVTRLDTKDNMQFIAPTAKVLIVDDINTNLTIAEGLMSSYKMSIDVCKSGMEAIELVQTNKYDIVFMDHMMPEMDGIETTLRIRKLNGGNEYYKNVPIIALTANAIAGVKEVFLQSGLNDFLAKPIEVSKLHTILKKWIPREKQKKYRSEIINDDAPYFEIEGVDVKAGICLTGNMVDRYLKILSVFHKDGAEKIADIKSSLATNDMRLYITHVHALKSAAANIGAKELSEFAKSLEIAGNSGDAMFIQNNTGRFLSELEILLRNIGCVLSDNKINAAETNAPDLDFLRQELAGLKTALADMDTVTVEEIINSLEQKIWDEQTTQTIESISQNILICEYDKAGELIDGLLFKREK